VFGMVFSQRPVIDIEAVTDQNGRLTMPQSSEHLLSTMGMEVRAPAL